MRNIPLLKRYDNVDDDSSIELIFIELQSAAGKFESLCHDQGLICSKKATNLTNLVVSSSIW